MARLPRPNSFCAVPSREAVYSVPHISYSRPTSFKGKEVVGRWPACESQRTSPTPSKGEPSSVESSSGSTGSGSQDDMDIKPTHARVRLADLPHRLHPSHPRRRSDASIERPAAGKPTKGTGPPNHARDSRPPPSMRGFASIAQVAATPPVHPSLLSTPLPSRTAFVGRRHAKGSSSSSSSAGSLTPRPNSTYSVLGSTATSSRLATSGPETSVVPKAEHPSSWTWAFQADLDKSWSPDNFGEAHGAGQQRPCDERNAHTLEAPDIEHLDSTDAKSVCKDAARVDRDQMPPPSAHEDIVNVFPEQAPLPEPSTLREKKRDAKRRGKIAKKSRWPNSKTSAVVV